MQRFLQRLSLGLGAAVVSGVVLIIGSSWSSGAAIANHLSVGALLRGTSGEVVGQASFTQVGNAVRVEVTVSGLTPGFHGFHVHAVGSCDPTTAFMSAGGHLNVDGRNHDQHMGDQPLLYVLADGTGMLSFLTDRYRVDDLMDDDANALVIHALPDNFANIPTRYAPSGPDEATRATGDAGGRVACGVIEAGK